MADFDSALYTSQINSLITRNEAPSHRPLQQNVKYALFDYTWDGAEVDNAVIRLGYIGVDGARVIPELSRFRDTGAGDTDVDVKLSYLPDGGTAVDLSGTISVDNTIVAFTGIAGQVAPTMLATDVIQLEVDDAALGATTAGQTSVIEVAYVSEYIQ